ncbi:MAG: hypothetical protein JRN42_07145, partial [Nitrososphaerota archaeon]|nr:hypothetical protein [Nitrososphaerota archaeon]
MPQDGFDKAEPRCSVCALPGDPSMDLDVWLAQGRSYRWIEAELFSKWGLRVSDSSIQRHVASGHAAKAASIARRAVDMAEGQRFGELRSETLAAMKTVVDVGL